MRKSREIMIGQFWPKTYEEFFAVTQATHDFNAAYRQVSSYWEMAYGFAKHGVVHSGLLLESGGEGLSRISHRTGEISGIAATDGRANSEQSELFGARRRLTPCVWQPQ